MWAVNQIDLDRWWKGLSLRVIYKDDVRVLIHHRRVVDGYSVVVKGGCLGGCVNVVRYYTGYYSC